jgi:hypothetical protein
MELATGTRQDPYDSGYTAVGSWRVEARTRAGADSLSGAGVGGQPPIREVAMTEVPGTDREQAGENVLHDTPLVPESVEDSDDDPRSTDEPVNRGDEGQTGESIKPPPGSTELDT